jgi:hypothetical protein
MELPTLAEQQQRAEEMTKHAPPMALNDEDPTWRREWHARKVAEWMRKGSG